MSPELENIRRQVERLTRDWSPSEWHYAPAGKWTCAQILEHLLLSYTGTTKALLQVMKDGRPKAGKPRLADRLRTFPVTKMGILPEGRTSPKPIVPQNGLEQESLPRFYDALVALDSTLTDAERRFGSQIKLLDHPMLGPLNAREWRQFHRTHAKHHLRQIAELARQLAGRRSPGREASR